MLRANLPRRNESCDDTQAESVGAIDARERGFGADQPALAQRKPMPWLRISGGAWKR